MFAMSIKPEVLKKLREDYPEGCIVELVEMCDPYRKMPVGMHGVVQYVDDAGGIHTNFSLKVRQTARGFFVMARRRSAGLLAASQGPTTKPWRKSHRRMVDF